MRIAVTGGTGFVGAHLAERLRGEGHEVVIVSRGVHQRPDGAVRTIAAVLNRRVLVIQLPLTFHRTLGWVTEKVMTVPLVTRSQVRLFEEEIVEPVLAPDELPDDLQPSTPFDERSIRAGLPEPGRFELKDLRFVNDPTQRVR